MEKEKTEWNWRLEREPEEEGRRGERMVGRSVDSTCLARCTKSATNMPRKTLASLLPSSQSHPLRAGGRIGVGGKEGNKKRNSISTRLRSISPSFSRRAQGKSVSQSFVSLFSICIVLDREACSQPSRDASLSTLDPLLYIR